MYPRFINSLFTCQNFPHKNWRIQKSLHRNHFSSSLLSLHIGVDLFLNGKLIKLIRNLQIRLNGKKGIEPSDYISGWMFWKRQDVILRPCFAKRFGKKVFLPNLETHSPPRILCNHPIWHYVDCFNCGSWIRVALVPLFLPLERVINRMAFKVQPLRSGKVKYKLRKLFLISWPWKDQLGPWELFKTCSWFSDDISSSNFMFASLPLHSQDRWCHSQCQSLWKGRPCRTE